MKNYLYCTQTIVQNLSR